MCRFEAGIPRPDSSEDQHNPKPTRGIHLANTIRIINDLRTTSTTTADPAAGIEERIALIARLKLDGDAELVLGGRRGVGAGGILQLLEDLARARAPAEGVHGDVGRGVVLGLQQVLGVDARGEVFDGDLVVLAAGLGGVISICMGEVEREREKGRELTITMPLPQRPAHWPPMKLIQLRLPNRPEPTGIFGLSLTDMRKSSSSVGVGMDRDRAMSFSSKRWRRLLAGMASFMTFW